MAAEENPGKQLAVSCHSMSLAMSLILRNLKKNGEGGKAIQYIKGKLTICVFFLHIALQ